jgi:hypothetical protein
MALVSPGIQISINDQSQYVNSNVGSVPLVLLATAQDKTYNNAPATGTSKANAGKLLSFTSQRDLVTAMGTPTFQLSAAGTPVNGSELNEYGLMAAYSALGLGNQLYAIRADVDLTQLTGTSNRPVGNVANSSLWLDTTNTEFGIYALNAATSEFDHVSPLIVSDPAQVNFITYAGTTNVPTPTGAVGKPHDYAIPVVNTDAHPLVNMRLFYKTDGDSVAVSAGGPGANTWVQVGSPEWQLSVPTVMGTLANPTFTSSGGTNTVTVNTVNITFSVAGGVAALAAAINGGSIPGVKASVTTTGKLNIYITSSAKSNGSAADGKLIVVDDVTDTPFAKCGIDVTKTYYSPYFFYGSYAQQPSGGWFSTDTSPRPSNSIWWKTSVIGGGFNPALKRYNSTLDTWEAVSAPLYLDYATAIYGLDPVGGGKNIPHGQIVATYRVGDTTYNSLAFADQRANLGADGAVIATGDVPADSNDITGTFTVQATVPGNGASLAQLTTYTITLTGTTSEDFVTDFLAAEVPYINVLLNSNGTISIIHEAGGAIRLLNSSGTPLQAAGFVQTTGSKPYQRNNYTVASANGAVVVTDFVRVDDEITYSETTPYANPADGRVWYYSNPVDVDIMINDNGWKGYQNVTSDARGYNLSLTDPMGTIVAASEPVAQTDGTELVSGDLWLDTGDLANYPALSRWNGSKWVAIDKTDHITSNGIVFADARWGTNGSVNPVSDAFPAIADMLSGSPANYTDLDVPSPALYPRGTLLFNTRRSGYNVKKFVSNYFNSVSFPNQSLPPVTDAWVSASGLDENGAMKAGSAAQRSIVVAALQSAVDSNIDAREENYRFNLLCAPGYPELIDNLVMLNDDRSNTGFVIGDTPMTLEPSATALTAWSNNSTGTGLATASPYLAVYYPAGLTNDLAGNTVAVPASHAVLRTFLYNDNVSYPWFAPAGVHRGLVSNLSDVGYVNAQTGSFIHNGVNQALRDTLYTLNINPIAQLPGTGLVVWGQETRSGSSTSRNRVNVVRLENYLRVILKSIANGFMFEPNDQITRKTIATQIEAALHDVLSKRGLYDFLVICDTNNNTPSTIANNQLYVDVAIEPMRDVEFIYIPIALYNPGTVANLGAANT